VALPAEPPVPPVPPVLLLLASLPPVPPLPPLPTGSTGQPVSTNSPPAIPSNAKTRKFIRFSFYVSLWDPSLTARRLSEDDRQANNTVGNM
jgi:hypothetical protein